MTKLLPKLVEYEDRFDRDGDLVHMESESSYNTVEEAIRQAKHDLATGQRQIVHVIDPDSGKKYTPKMIIDFKLGDES